MSRPSGASWVPPGPVMEERHVLDKMKEACRKKPNRTEKKFYKDLNKTKEELIIELHEFEIYNFPSPKKETDCAFELSSLLQFRTKKLSFRGFVSVRGSAPHYVENVNIKDISIEGYGDNEPRIIAYIQTENTGRDPKFNMWYRLQVPANPYTRFHATFEWVALFGKFVIDYLEDQTKGTVGLANFQNSFRTWLLGRFKPSSELQSWVNAGPPLSVGFQVAVHAYIDYIFQQASSLASAPDILDHPIWSVCTISSVKMQPVRCEKTTCTPAIYYLYRDMHFKGELERLDINPQMREKQEQRKASLGFPKASFIGAGTVNRSSHQGNSLAPWPRSIRVGDVVSIRPDIQERLKHGTTEDDWLAYVQRIEHFGPSAQRLFVIWLYRPSETLISTAEFPFDKELFMSDNCNCQNVSLFSTDVNRVHTIDWAPRNLDTAKDFFTRTKYLAAENAYVTLQNRDGACSCGSSIDTKWRPGDTVYIEKIREGSTVLEPVIVDRHQQVDQQVIVRRLLRLKRDCQGIPINGSNGTLNVAENELVFTDEYTTIPAHRIGREFHMRCFGTESAAPYPYNQQGQSDFWILSARLLTKSNGRQYIEYLNQSPARIKEGPLFSDPGSGSPLRALPGLSIFSGGGNLDRGLEEGGAVKFKTVIDISPSAIHTQLANSRHQGSKFYLGSVDDYLKEVVTKTGKEEIGSIAFIAAGSPCPGFSKSQPNLLSPESLRNASHITTFCSFVDIFRPERALLENVIDMAATKKEFDGKNVLAQTVSCLVSLGYQVTQFIMDSWSHGSEQHRSRLFISITAPGLIPMEMPKHTHSHEVVAKSIGKLPNGKRFGHRKLYPTPFESKRSLDAMSDLPNIGNGDVQCLSFPDHRLTRPLNYEQRKIISLIPTDPPGQGLADVIATIPKSALPESVQGWKEIGKSYRRVKGDGLIPTIMTSITPQNSRGGAQLHPHEPRMLTIQEARRAQGHPDDEVIIGTPMEQWKIIGNGVDRRVSRALGITLRYAVEKDLLKDGNSSVGA